MFQAPLYDPVMNEVYQSRGHAVPNIAQVMDVPTPLDFYSIIRYTMSQPLHFTPGTRVVESNLGYLVLGRVIEEVTAMMYEDYVKRFVLIPCGMWHTRLGPQAPSSLHSGHKLDKDVARKDTPRLERSPLADGQLDLFEMLDPTTVDSTLGWYSTVFDMARFARCVFDGEEVLNDASLETLLKRQDSAPVQHSDTWLCAGFHTNTKGAVWQDGDAHADDVLLYHDLLADKSKASDGADTWVVLLHGNRLHHLRHKVHDLMKDLGGMTGDQSSRNHFVQDLSDVNAADNVLVKFRVDEHHLDAYVSAVKQEGYDIRWVSPYTHRYHTSFLLISRLITGGAESELDFKVEHGLGEKQLLARKLHMERHDYNLTFLQSYRSQSHENVYTFLAVFRKHAYSTDTQLKYGTDHLPEPYDKLVQMYQEKHFHPLVQSVLPHADDKEEHLSFVFVQTLHSKPVDFKNYYRLTDSKQVEKTILQNAQKGRTLSFLDAYELQGNTRFAAVFTNETRPRWHFEGDLSEQQATELIESRVSSGLWPSLAVAFARKEQGIKFAVFLRSDEDTDLPAHSRLHRGDTHPLGDPRQTGDTHNLGDTHYTEDTRYPRKRQHLSPSDSDNPVDRQVNSASG